MNNQQESGNLNPRERFMLEVRRLRDGGKQAYEISGEDRRDALFEIREQRAKAEAPRASIIFNQHPMIDALRQFKTVYGKNPSNNPLNTGAPGFIANHLMPGLQPFDDAAFAFRAGASLNAGHQALGQNMPAIPKSAGKSPEQHALLKAKVEKEIASRMPAYKQALADLPLSQKLGFLGGSAGADLTQNFSRNIWWLINAAQATVDVASESLVNAANPDLYGMEPIQDLNAAEREGLVRFKATEEQKLEAAKAADRQAFDDLVKKERKKRADVTDTSGMSPAQFAEYLDYAEEEIKQDLIDPDSADPLRYGQSDTDFRNGQLIKGEQELRKQNDPQFYKRNRPGVKRIGGHFKRRSYAPNLVNFVSMAPAAVGINAGLGLLSRPEGYATVLPDEDDARKNSNLMDWAVEQVGAKYFLGRTGRLMDEEDFLLERPDVSSQEYNQYSRYLRDRDIDLNLFDDGKVNLGGVIKNNPDGIHGAEISFLGKSIPLNEAVIPTAAAMGGTVLGTLLPNIRRVRMKRQNTKLPTIQKNGKDYNRYTDPDGDGFNKVLGYMPEIMEREGTTGERINNPIWKSNNPAIKVANPIAEKIENFFEDPSKLGPEAVNKARVAASPLLLGAAGLTGGLIGGGAIEDERRKRKFEERYPGVDFDLYKEKSTDLFDEKVRLAKENPNRVAEKEKSNVGFNKRTQQAGIQNYALTQGVQIDQLINEERKERARELQNKQQWAFNKFNDIEDTYKDKENRL